MNQADINAIQEKLGIELPTFYVETMLNYPFPKDSFGEEFMLPNSPDILLDCNGVFSKEDKCFAVGSDGGEFLYYIKLNGKETVYVFDLEKSDVHNSIEAHSWKAYLKKIKKVQKEIEEDERQEAERKKNKKWWQFWI
ncbi:hypothetical protein [Lacihabitans lacunae]|uniref:Knr4/Smi1-like domain-containing protein n=1 Tax=Lacihabitans lacunae TaxID=1028214 RepID=A0ABV7YZ06_9BACT